jgi:hypothetical protein
MMRCQRLLEPNHDIGVMPLRFQIAVRTTVREAVDKRVEQVLLERSRDFRIPDQLTSCLSETTGLRMKPQQARRVATRRSKHPADRRCSDLQPGQRLTARGELLGGQRYKAPLAFSIGSLVQSLTAAMEYDVANSQVYSAIR